MKITHLIPAFAVLSACAAGPQNRPPAIAPAIARGDYMDAGRVQATLDPVLSRWWETLSDPLLSELIDQALSHSPTIEAAQASIREAQAQLDSQRGSGLPTLKGAATALRAALPGSGAGLASLSVYNLGANASWEPDLTGAARQDSLRAQAVVGQKFAALADAQVSLSAEVAQAYVALRQAQLQLDLLEQSSTNLSQALELTRRRIAAGTVAELDGNRIDTQLQATRARVTAQRGEIALFVDELTLLCGAEPGVLNHRLLDGDASIPLPPARVVVGDPAQLLASRPDIRQAEQALAASNAQVGIDRARLMPSLRFTGILGIGGPSVNDVIDTGNLSSLLLPQLSLPILDWGRAKANVRASEARRDETEARYRQTVLAALHDAESGLTRFGTNRVQFGSLLAAEASARQTLALSDMRQKAGTTSTLDHLDVERQFIDASLAAAQGRAGLTASYITLQKSLGLGWNSAPQLPG